MILTTSSLLSLPQVLNLMAAIIFGYQIFHIKSSLPEAEQAKIKRFPVLVGEHLRHAVLLCLLTRGACNHYILQQQVGQVDCGIVQLADSTARRGPCLDWTAEQAGMWSRSRSRREF
jgi:hypothetical protein